MVDSSLLGRRLSRVIATGVVTALVFLVGGTSLLIVGGGAETDEDPLAYPNPAYRLDITGSVQDALAGDGVAILELGVLVLVLTPAARVAVAGFLFWRGREWVFATISMAILAVLLFGWFVT